jgi:hypothetical protein
LNYMKNIFDAKIVTTDEIIKMLQEVKWGFLGFQQKKK